jgi:hypothetical protein
MITINIATVMAIIIMLVGAFKHVSCSMIYGIILPIDSRWLKPPTSNDTFLNVF